MPFGLVAAEVAPEIIGGLEGAGAVEGGMGVAAGGLDMFAPEAGMGLTSEFGGGLDASAGLDAGGWDALGGAWEQSAGESANQNAMLGALNGTGAGGGWMGGVGQWMQQNPMLSYLGIGSILSGLNSRNTTARNNAIQRQSLERQLQRQALMDNPPAYAPMSGPGLTPTNNWGANVDSKPTYSYEDLKNYGAQPEKHWAARGGLAEHTPVHGGGLEQARMVDHPEGGGQDDNVPAMLSPKEYVLDADVVSAIGDGNPDEGARRLDAFRERVRTHKRSAPAHRIPPMAHPIERYLRRAA